MLTLTRNAASGIVFTLICSLTAICAAFTPDPNSLFDMSLEELMDVQIVISASRLESKLIDQSIPVSIISADDIHYSGLTSIPEILQFAPGIDMIPLSRTRYAVGVRGLHDFVADRTLMLINGRPADNVVFGGPEFYRYPVLIEDIERIEILRGPGGAAWGANAFTGILNVITKKPGSDPGWFLSTTVTEYGDSYNHVRTMGARDRFSWRLSVGYETLETSDHAGAGRMFSSRPALDTAIGFSDYRVHDRSRNFRLDSEFNYRYSETTEISFGAAFSHMEGGDWEYLGFFPQDDSRFETLRSFLKISHVFDENTTGYFQWANNFNDSDQPSLFEWITVENDFEAQLNTQIGKHRLSVGGSLRFTYIDTDTPYPQSVRYPGGPFNEVAGGLFLIDRFEVTDRLSLEGQVRGDWYSDADADWSTRLSALYTLDPENEEIVRFSFAKAFRTPHMITANNITHRVPHPIMPGVNLLNVNSVRDLQNEQTWSFPPACQGNPVQDRCILPAVRSTHCFRKRPNASCHVYGGQSGQCGFLGYRNTDQL
jgi:iron complex outermembrane receptor protein